MLNPISEAIVTSTNLDRAASTPQCREKTSTCASNRRSQSIVCYEHRLVSVIERWLDGYA